MRRKALQPPGERETSRLIETFTDSLFKNPKSIPSLLSYDQREFRTDVEKLRRQCGHSQPESSLKTRFIEINYSK